MDDLTAALALGAMLIIGAVVYIGVTLAAIALVAAWGRFREHSARIAARRLHADASRPWAGRHAEARRIAETEMARRAARARTRSIKGGSDGVA